MPAIKEVEALLAPLRCCRVLLCLWQVLFEPPADSHNSAHFNSKQGQQRLGSAACCLVQTADCSEMRGCLQLC